MSKCQRRWRKMTILARNRRREGATVRIAPHRRGFYCALGIRKNIFGFFASLNRHLRWHGLGPHPVFAWEFGQKNLAPAGVARVLRNLPKGHI